MERSSFIIELKKEVWARVGLVAHTCGETFIFETYAELKKR